MAKRHGFVLSEDDPVLATVTLNELLLEDYLRRMQHAVEQGQLAVSKTTDANLENTQKAVAKLVTAAGPWLQEQITAAGARAQEQILAAGVKVRDQVAAAGAGVADDIRGAARQAANDIAKARDAREAATRAFQSADRARRWMWLGAAAAACLLAATLGVVAGGAFRSPPTPPAATAGR